LNMAVIEAKLSKEQKQAVALLSIGSVLEYFDLMLYVHMAVVLNDIFFPQSGYFSKAQIAAFSFWSTHALRPVGAMFFGRIGDRVGRKAAVILSATVMAVCCLTLASLPSYQKIGIIAPILLTLCRMVQGVSASAEITGAQIYLAESVKPPYRDPLVSSVAIFTTVGTTMAIATGAVFSNTKLFPDAWANDAWRFAFVIGAAIGIVGAVARNSLKEAAEFADRQRAFKEKFKKIGVNFSHENIKVPLSTSVAYFFIHAAGPTLFYLIYVYCGSELRKSFGFSNAQVMQNNIWVGIANFGATLLWSCLSYSFRPLKIVRLKATGFVCLIALFPLMMKHYPSPQLILAFQCLVSLFYLGTTPAAAILFKHFPTVKRFRYSGTLSALAKSGGYFVGPSLIAIATDQFGYQGVWMVFIPITILFFAGLRYFEKKAIEESLLQPSHSLSNEF
jgi:MFS transporter, MHS family, proline/betaine transporter